MNAANKSATQILKSFFNSGISTGVGSVLINNPIFLVSQSISSPKRRGSAIVTSGSLPQELRITVQLSYYMNPNTGVISSYTLKTLTNALIQLYESVLERPVNVQLELARQYQPYMDASILAQYLAINASRFGFNRMINVLLNVVPFLNPKNSFFSLGGNTQSRLSQVNQDFGQQQISYITGIKVQLSGLLTSQRNRSRKTVYTASAGTLNSSATENGLSLNTATHNQNRTMSIDYGSYTSKSRLGAFTVKV